MRGEPLWRVTAREWTTRWSSRTREAHRPGDRSPGGSRSVSYELSIRGRAPLIATRSADGSERVTRVEWWQSEGSLESAVMHGSSMAAMDRFISEHLATRRGRNLRILDVGSADVNGSYRSYFDDPRWEYTGIDLAPGPGVDLVLRSPYDWSGVPSNSFDVVVSGQAFEHIEFPWISILCITRALVEGGLLCLIVPSGGPEHRYPVDCWRYYPDGVLALARWADLEPVSVKTSWAPEKDYNDGSAEWADTVLVARKPKTANRLRRWAVEGKRAVLRDVLAFQASRRHSLG